MWKTVFQRITAYSLVIQAVMAAVTPLASAGGLYFSNEQLCKAAVATAMGRNPKTMMATKAKDGVVHVSYKRPDDGTLWKLKCKIEGSEIVWGTESGRWRNHPDDGKMYYDTPNESTLHVQEVFPDSSKIDKKFSKKQLQ